MDVVTSMYPLYIKSFTDDCTWKDRLWSTVKETSSTVDPKCRYVKMAHVFFNSPQECSRGVANLQFLTEYDVKTMYPDLSGIVVPEGKAMLILHCNNASLDGKHATRVNILV